MNPEIAHKASFWLAIAAAVTVPLVPLVYGWLDPAPPLKLADGMLGGIFFAVDLLGGMGRGFKIGVIMAGIGALVVVLSSIAFIAARYAGQPRQAQWMCVLPLLLMVFGALVVEALGY